MAVIYSNEMSPNSSDIETLLGSVRRSLLGGLIGIIALVLVGIAVRTLPSGDYLVGGGSAVLAVGAIAWLVYLFIEGYHDGV
jgi:hypothetical protein